METVTRNASDDELLRLVCKWVGVLALGEYEKVVDSLGYALAYQEAIPDPEVIRERIEGYLSPDYYPDETQFPVTELPLQNPEDPHGITLLRRIGMLKSRRNWNNPARKLREIATGEPR
ncbi:MAG: hypothetical protein ACK5YQ_10130 [Betaproteobacteria bacterium]